MGGSDTINPGEIETGIAGRACEACHKKKTKCDMQQPTCGLCRRTNKECHFPSTRKRPSRQEPSVRAKLQKVNGNLDRLVELLEANPSIEHESLKGILNATTTSTGSSGFQIANKARTGSVSARSNASLGGGGGGDDMSNSPVTHAPSQAPPFPISHELCMHLIDLYFDKIQPWLPIFHRPTFMIFADQVLLGGSDALADLRPMHAVLFTSIFALSARFSTHHELDDVLPRDKGEKFIRVSEHLFKTARDEEVDCLFLRACVLMACYHYASGHSKRGWYITHMCIRGCYELGLHQIDDDTEDEDADEEYWVEKESLRRTFWAIWELDSFGSIVKRKPFAIDWRHIEVKMPVSDEAWFAGTKIESSRFLPGSNCWRTLVDSPNQDERAWALLAKASVGHVFDLMLFKDGITTEQLTTAENNLSCFKLAMPESLQLTSPSWSAAGMNPARKNWAIATNLYLAAASFVLTRMPIIGQLPSPQEDTTPKELAAYSSRVLELNEILKRWPADAIPYSHPCLACTILTYDESLINLLPLSAPVGAYRNLSGLILAKIAERWTLGAVLSRVRDLAHNYHNSDEVTKADLVRQYPVYFERELKRNKKPLIDDPSRVGTQSISPPHASSSQIGQSIEQSLSPEQTSQPSTNIQQASSPRQLLQLQQQAQQQPTPPYSYATSAPFDAMYADSMNTSFQDMNPFSNTSPIAMTSTNTSTSAGTNVNANLGTTTFPPPTSTTSAAGQISSPEDIDSLFSGFLQEPWWQDYGGVNFVV